MSETVNYKIPLYDDDTAPDLTDNGPYGQAMEIIDAQMKANADAANGLKLADADNTTGTAYQLQYGDGTAVTAVTIGTRSSNTIVGNFSRAEGDSTTASGDFSHAEGGTTTASGDFSHAEGGTTTASGGFSHAEGVNTTASGDVSHAEGDNTTASGGVSHAEGRATTASGDFSHAEGYGTIAGHRSQHVFGEFNVIDSSSTTSSARGTYVEVVGNGSKASNRSNARTLDWDGNEVLAGTLTATDFMKSDGTALYTPPTATADTLGMVKPDGETVTVTNGTLSVPDMTGATSSVAGVHGLVPQPAAGDEDKYLKGDGTWGEISGGSSSGSTVILFEDVTWPGLGDSETVPADSTVCNVLTSTVTGLDRENYTYQAISVKAVPDTSDLNDAVLSTDLSFNVCQFLYSVSGGQATMKYVVTYTNHTNTDIVVSYDSWCVRLIVTFLQTEK